MGKSPHKALKKAKPEAEGDGNLMESSPEGTSVHGTR